MKSCTFTNDNNVSILLLESKYPCNNSATKSRFALCTNSGITFSK